MTTCRQCGGEIHPERLKALPRTLTCSKQCSVNDQQELNRQSTRRAYQRKLRKTERE